MRFFFYTVAILFAGTSVSAESLGERLKGTVEKIEKGAVAVGEGASSVADSVSDGIDSTAALIEGEGSPAETRAKMDSTAEHALDRLFSEQPESEILHEQAAGYAVFDSRKLTLVGISGGGGRGVAISKMDERRVYMNMATAGVGLSLGIGGFETQIVMLFETEAMFADFVTHGFDASAQAGSMFGDETADVEVAFRNGRAVFVLTKKGWKLATSIGGTKYWPAKDLN